MYPMDEEQYREKQKIERELQAERRGQAKDGKCIPIAYDRCTSALQKLDFLLKELESELSMVLKPERATDQAEGVEAVGPADYSDIAMRFNGVASFIEELQIRVERLNLRIDL